MPELSSPIFKSAFSGPDEEAQRRGRRPVIFDILAPDQETSLLNLKEDGWGDLRLVLHVNPKTMSFNYAKQTERVQTRGGFVEFHWGDAAEEISFTAATGGFMRMYTGMSNITGGDQGRRETIAYDKYLDLLALFHNNGAIYDAFGNIAVQGFIKMTFDGGIHIGWFDGAFTVTEEASSPYQFNVTTRFIIDREIMRFRTANLIGYDGPAATVSDLGDTGGVQPATAIVDGLIDPFDQTGRPPLLENPGSPADSGLIDPFAQVGDEGDLILEEDEADLILEEEPGGLTIPGSGDSVAIGGGISSDTAVQLGQVTEILLNGTPEEIAALEQSSGRSADELRQLLGL
jgi:hypothetical protein